MYGRTPVDYVVTEDMLNALNGASHKEESSTLQEVMSILDDDQYPVSQQLVIIFIVAKHRM